MKRKEPNNFYSRNKCIVLLRKQLKADKRQNLDVYRLPFAKDTLVSSGEHLRACSFAIR